MNQAINFTKTNFSTFLVKDLFKVTGSVTTPQEVLESYGPGPYAYVRTKAVNNGVAGFYNYFTEEGNVLTIDSAVLGYCSYQEKPFSASDHVEVLHPKFKLNRQIAMYLVTLLNKEQFRYSYGRKSNHTNINNTRLVLPSTIDKKANKLVPDWIYIENFIKSLNINSPRSNNKRSSILELKNCIFKTFKLSDILDIHYGVNLELINCEETKRNDNNSVNFVSRIEGNNGVSARVKLIDNIQPEPAGSISIAGGGSVLSTFVQEEPYYSGRDLFVAIPKDNISLLSKLYLCTLIKSNAYRFAYGRQANKTLGELEIPLPITPDNSPDWITVDAYMKSLPFGDCL